LWANLLDEWCMKLNTVYKESEEKKVEEKFPTCELNQFKTCILIPCKD